MSKVIIHKIFQLLPVAFLFYVSCLKSAEKGKEEKKTVIISRANGQGTEPGNITWDEKFLR